MTTFWQSLQKPSNHDFSRKTWKTRKTQKQGKNRGFQRFHRARTFFTKTRFLPCFWRFQRFQVWKQVFTKTAFLACFQAFSGFSTPEPGFHENSVFMRFLRVFSDFAHQGRFSRKRGFWPVFACFPHFPRARMRTRRVPVACAPRASYVFK